MPSRDKSATVQLSKIRMSEGMRAQLAEEAKSRGVSLNAVIVERLSASLVNDAVLGTRHAKVMANAFYLNGQIAAQYEGHAEWEPAQWILDAGCYETAALAVIKTLWQLHPARDQVRWAWKEWSCRLVGFLGGMFAPADAGREDLTVSPNLSEVEAGRRDRKEHEQRQKEAA